MHSSINPPTNQQSMVHIASTILKSKSHSRGFGPGTSPLDNALMTHNGISGNSHTPKNQAAKVISSPHTYG